MPEPMPFWLSREEVRELDRRAIEEWGVPGVVLMENAGRGCAELLMRLDPDRQPVVILCGPGNNGGDGLVMARHLHNHDQEVHVAVFARPEDLSPDAATNYRPVERGQVPLTVYHVPPGEPLDRAAFLQRLRPGVWVVDALFGTGLSRPLGPPYADLIEVLDSHPGPVLAVDIPSGLDCDTGVPLGPVVRATQTATFVAHKQGFLNPQSRPWTGEVHVIDIGAPRVLVDEYRRRRGGPGA